MSELLRPGEPGEWEYVESEFVREIFTRIPELQSTVRGYSYRSPVPGVSISTLLKYAKRQAELIQDSGIPGTWGFHWQPNFERGLLELLADPEGLRREAEAEAVMRCLRQLAWEEWGRGQGL